MPTINEIAVTYRQHLARFPKHNTRTDYSKRLAMLERWCSMHGITSVEEIDFLQFLDHVFLDRGVSPRTYNNYRTWLRSFCSWMIRQHLLDGDPMDGIAPMREPGKVRQPLPGKILRQIRDYWLLNDYDKFFEKYHDELVPLKTFKFNKFRYRVGEEGKIELASKVAADKEFWSTTTNESTGKVSVSLDTFEALQFIQQAGFYRIHTAAR